VKAGLAALETRLAPLQSQIDRLSRQFWVTKAQVKGNKYDLSASRYRQAEQDEAYFETPRVTLERLLELEEIMKAAIEDIQGMLG
jgi:type I restriction enzyme M protein